MTTEKCPHRSRARYLPLAGLLSALAGWYVWIALLAAAQPQQASLPPLPEPQAGERVLVFAPHEDDETLGAALFMRRAMLAGAEVFVCLMTAGEGEELGAALLNRRPLPSPRGFVRLGQVRQRETLRALSQIGLPADHVIFLDYPNMGLQWLWSASNWSRQSLWRSPFTRTTTSPFANSRTPQAPFCGAAVRDEVGAVLAQVRPTLILTVHPADIHPDHWPTYGFVKLALAQARGNAPDGWAARCRLYAYLVHRRGWPSPWGYYPELPLDPPPSLSSLPANRWLALSVTPEEVALKNRLILLYRSQMARFDMLLRAFARRTEVFAEIPDLSLAAGDLAAQPGFTEPVADSRLLRKHPAADLAEVSCWVDGEGLRLKLRTQAPLNPHVQIRVILHLTPKTRDARQVIEVTLTPGGEAQVLSASERHGPVPHAPLGETVSSEGDTVTVLLPRTALGETGPLLVDVLTRLGRLQADHSLTRTVHLPAPE